MNQIIKYRFIKETTATGTVLYYTEECRNNVEIWTYVQASLSGFQEEGKEIFNLIIENKRSTKEVLFLKEISL